MNKASGWFPGGQFTTPQYICPTYAGGVRLLSWGSNPPPPPPPPPPTPLANPALSGTEVLLGDGNPLYGTEVPRRRPEQNTLQQLQNYTQATEFYRMHLINKT